MSETLQKKQGMHTEQIWAATSTDQENEIIPGTVSLRLRATIPSNSSGTEEPSTWAGREVLNNEP